MEPTYGTTTGHSHAPHGRCSGGHGIRPDMTPGGVGRAVISGDLVQSRDFHYSVEPAPVYRRPREVAYHTQAQVRNRAPINGMAGYCLPMISFLIFMLLLR